MTISEIASSRLDSRFVLPYAVQHETKTSIQHWQLRDLLVFPSVSRPEYLSVFSTHVYQNNIKTGEKKGILTDLDFSPTCLTGVEDLVAVGGQRSQLVVKHTSTGWVKAKTIGGQINNCVTLMVEGRAGVGGPKVVVGNNDETIRILSLPDLGTDTCIQVDAAVNYLSVSPDGRMMACVGDMNEVYIYDLTYGNKHIFTFKMRDSGFSLSWHPSSMLLAAGSQDGQAHIWDVRGASTSSSSLKPLASYRGSQALPKGAIRNVKFSQSGSVDLLAFTEHSSYLNLVDARLIGCGEGLCEAVRVSPVDAEVNLAGMAFSPQGKSVVVATENAALEYLTDLRARHSFPSGSVL